MKAIIQVLLVLFFTKATAHVHYSTTCACLPNIVTSIPSGGGRRKWRRVPTQVVVAAFNDIEKAEEAADLLNDAATAGILHFRNLAVVQKEANGEIKIHEIGYHTVPYAATVGMFVGGLSLLLLGSAGVVAGGAAGAIVGGAGQALLEEEDDKKNKRATRSLDKDRLVSLGDILKPGTSALVVVFEEVNVDKRTTQNVRIRRTLDAVLAHVAIKIKRAIRRKRDVAVAVSVNEKGIRAVRMVSDEDAIDIQGMFVTSTSEGVRLGRASVSPHHEAIAYEVAETTTHKI